MKLNDGDHAQCPCCKKCTDCTAGFQKLVDLKDAGLVIYRQTTETEDVNKFTRIIELSTKTTEDVFILHNTKDIDLSPSDCLREIEQNSIDCPRCRKIIDHAQKLLKKVPTINKNDVKGICEHCRAKEASCFECKNVVKKFVASKTERSEETKQRVKQWLTEIKYLLKSIKVDTTAGPKSTRAHSETNVNQLCRDISKQSDGKQIFYPETDWADLDGVLPSTENIKRMYTHSSHFQKIKSDAYVDIVTGNIVEPCTSTSKDDIRRQCTDQYGLYLKNAFSEDLQDLHFASLPLHEGQKKQKHVQLKDVPPVPIQSKYSVLSGSDESITFAQNSHTRPKTGAYINRIDGKTFEDKLSTRFKSGDVHNRGKSSQIQDTLEFEQIFRPLAKRYYAIDKKPGRSLKQDIEEVFYKDVMSKIHQLIAGESLENMTKPMNYFRQYHSEESLLKTYEATPIEVTKEGFEYVFPKNIPPDIGKPEMQTSSSELINDIQVKIILAKAKKEQMEEEKQKLKLDKEETTRIIREKKRRELEINNIPSTSKSKIPKTSKSLKELKDTLEPIVLKPLMERKELTNTTELPKVSRPNEQKKHLKELKQSQELKETKLQEQKISQVPRVQIKEPSELKKSKVPKEAKQLKDPQQIRQVKSHVEIKETKLQEQKISQVPREHIKEPSEFKKSKVPKQPKEAKQLKDPQQIRQVKSHVEIKKTKLAQEPKTINKEKVEKQIDVKRSKDQKQQKEPKYYTESKEKTEETKTQKKIKDSKTTSPIKKSATSNEPKQIIDTKTSKISEPRVFEEVKDLKESYSPEKQEIEEPKKLKTPEEHKNVTTTHAHDTKKPKAFMETKELKRSNDPGNLTNQNKETDPKKDLVRMSKIKLGKLSEIDFNPALTNIETRREKKDIIKKATLETEHKNLSKTKEIGKKEQKSNIALNSEVDHRKKEDDKLKSDEASKTANEPGICHYKELNIEKITLRRTSSFMDDYILRHVRTTRSAGKLLGNLNLIEKDDLQYFRRTRSLVSIGPYEEFLKRNLDKKRDIIIGEKIYKYTPSLRKRQGSGDFVLPYVVKSLSDVKIQAEKNPITKGMKPEHKPNETLKKGTIKQQTPESAKGVIHYALSDRTFIEKGWTMLPTEKVVRKMNVYRMYPSQPQFDWFQRNKIKHHMEYETGEKLAEFEENGRGRWYYKNGRLALDYYDAEELNAQQRFVIYSNGEPDERGRARPYTLLATFDYLGNGTVLDHSGKIRLKFNQTEGVLLDRSIGPVTHWKWHTLNDPPVLQQVMIDTQMTHKDPAITKLGGPNEKNRRPDNEDMLAIEFDNFIKEKSKKLTQTFKPFQIRMKALKINEHFSLKILDQATVYLIFRHGTTNLKLNVGMLLNHKEIVDTDTADVGDVANSLERFPARTDSLALLQKSIAHAQYYERMRTERELKLRPPQPCESADNLIAGVSKPLRTPLLTAPSGSTTTANGCKCSRKPTSCNVYYDARLN